MTYSQQTWADNAAGNTPITAAALNHMESGIAQAATFLSGNAAIVGGTPPTGFAPIIQPGTFTCTPDASGNYTYTFGTPFPNGVFCVVACPGDTASNLGMVTVTTASKTTFGFQSHTFTGGLVTTLCRVNFVAVGW